jgi:hypothetical protein
MSKINNVEWRDSEYLGEDSKRIGFIQRIEDEYVYEFKVICKQEGVEMTKYMEETDFTLYQEHYNNPKTGASTGILWFENLKNVTDTLNG